MLSDHLKGGSPPTTQSLGPSHLSCLSSELGTGLHQASSTGLGTFSGFTSSRRALPCDNNSGRMHSSPRAQLLLPLTHSCLVGDETPSWHPVEHLPSSRRLPTRPGPPWCRLGGQVWLCSQPLVRLLVPRRGSGHVSREDRGRLKAMRVGVQGESTVAVTGPPLQTFVPTQ